MGKIAIIYPNNIWVAPFLGIYRRVLDEKKIEYDMITWCRYGEPESGIQFYYHEKSRSTLKVLWAYYRFSRFVLNVVKKNNYEKLIVFTPQVGIFLSLFLWKKYRNKYIFDYRDLSIEQFSFFKPFMKMVLKNSYANVVSSPGFIKYLPQGYDFYISHNFNIEHVKEALCSQVSPYNKDIIKVLTIGAIRIDSNYDVIDALGNVPDFVLAFIGKGLASKELLNYSTKQGYKNIIFKGQYAKEDEPDIIKEHTLLNIVYPRIKSHDSALSNRFYNSLIYKRPMIVTKGGIQGYYVEKYHTGIAIDTCGKLNEQITSYLADLDFESYSDNCNKLLNHFLSDYYRWLEMVDTFIIAS